MGENIWKTIGRFFATYLLLHVQIEKFQKKRFHFLYISIKKNFNSMDWFEIWSVLSSFPRRCIRVDHLIVQGHYVIPRSIFKQRQVQRFLNLVNIFFEEVLSDVRENKNIFTSRYQSVTRLGSGQDD